MMARKSSQPRRALKPKAASHAETSLQQCYAALVHEASQGKALDETAGSVMAYLDTLRQRAVIIRRFIASAKPSIYFPEVLFRNRTHAKY